MGDAPVIGVRRAVERDVDTLVHLYRLLEKEMVALEEMWVLADGLPEPIEVSLAAEISSDDSIVVIGTIDDHPFGFMIARVEDMLPQASGERVGSIRYVFVEIGAREVGVGEEMRNVVMEALSQFGIGRFDAHVLPGHRLVKNFFESGGFSARSIIMHNDGD